VVLELSKEIVKETGYYNRTRKAAELTLAKIKQAHEAGELKLDEKEVMWLDKLTDDVATLPDDAETLTEDMIPQCEKLDPAKYDMN
jgi:methanol--5-hydroxybenzimidazolylcobamide Co-methyltransferase